MQIVNSGMADKVGPLSADRPSFDIYVLTRIGNIYVIALVWRVVTAFRPIGDKQLRNVRCLQRRTPLPAVNDRSTTVEKTAQTLLKKIHIGMFPWFDKNAPPCRHFI